MNFDPAPPGEIEHDLQILQEIERDPEVTQAGLAAQLGVAVGKVNWYVKRLIGKGYVKVTHLQRRKLHYFLTPSGLARKVELTQEYMQASLRVYRELRQAALKAMSEVHKAGYTAVEVQGEDEAAEIFQLTCLEQGMKLEKHNGGRTSVPTICPHDMNYSIIWPEEPTE